ncbi:hypothetical protein MUA04_00490 [Enterobacteriaceae bacterium H11S18]|uniref:hypothetical protein n=1 Tax=Dryocola clanedunensis TaxID=2925396 RepID=UPI0022F0CEF5|nr:hypothetical protein [Dryocola clanedunensis]MCT4708721.1 hypothetical protein [Dryocola clanedunensis]
MIQYVVKYGVDHIQIADAGSGKEMLLAALEHPAHGLTQKKAAEEVAVSLRKVATYWNQDTRV